MSGGRIAPLRVVFCAFCGRTLELPPGTPLPLLAHLFAQHFDARCGGRCYECQRCGTRFRIHARWLEAVGQHAVWCDQRLRWQ